MQERKVLTLSTHTNSRMQTCTSQLANPNSLLAAWPALTGSDLSRAASRSVWRVGCLASALHSPTLRAAARLSRPILLSPVSCHSQGGGAPGHITWSAGGDTECFGLFLSPSLLVFVCLCLKPSACILPCYLSLSGFSLFSTLFLALLRCPVSLNPCLYPSAVSVSWASLCFDIHIYYFYSSSGVGDGGALTSSVCF